MKLIAIIRAVSPSINNCELTFRARVPIDVAKAIVQHKAHEDCLAELGVEIVSVPAEPELPDAVFVEDAAVILDEVAVICNMGAPSRRPEVRSLVDTFSRYRPIKCVVGPATLDGGDVLRIGRSVFVGLSSRTNRKGLAQLTEILQPYGYDVQPVEVRRCLHLKSACSYVGDNTVLINRSLIDAEPFRQFESIDAPTEEPAAANVLVVNDVIIMPSSFSKTRALLEQRGLCVRAIDLSELQKAEAGVTCSSLIFKGETTATHV